MCSVLKRRTVSWLPQLPSIRGNYSYVITLISDTKQCTHLVGLVCLYLLTLDACPSKIIPRGPLCFDSSRDHKTLPAVEKASVALLCNTKSTLRSQIHYSLSTVAASLKQYNRILIWAQLLVYKRVEQFQFPLSNTLDHYTCEIW